MIWAIVSSQPCFCWLYRTSPSLAAKNIINLISVLTIWWCPCVESTLLLLEEGVCYDQCILLENSVSLWSASLFNLSIYLYDLSIYLGLLFFWLSCLLLLILICMCCLYVLEISPSSVASFANIFSNFELSGFLAAIKDLQNCPDNKKSWISYIQRKMNRGTWLVSLSKEVL